MSASGEAQIYDRGYRAYDGPRSGIGGAMLSVYVASVQRALGLRRKFRFKAVPLLTVLLAYAPAIAFLGLAILLPEEIASELVADYASYYGLLTIAVVLFTAFVAPELLSTDRRTGMFGLYLASPLTRIHYLVAKAAALVSVLLTVTMFPLLFLLIGYTVAGLGPDGFVDTLTLLGRIALSGLLMALYFTLFGMAGSTLTTRQGFAAAGIVMALVGSGGLSRVLVEVAEAPGWVRLFWFAGVPFEVIARLYGNDAEQAEGVTTLTSMSAWFAVCAVSILIISWGYRRLQVTK